ncbi:esterase/lipase family protein, partial [Streptomyces turgidiscabies]|uniref:esterase/lipase family protein n=1 Tax=Streptomyces turgidiscabies TaxID=85558 RepID=UPI0038F7AC09
TSSTDVAAPLAAEVARVLITTGAPKVALVGNSRGANTIRNYVRFGGGAANTAAVVLGGGVNHGVFNAPGGPNSEFNGAGALMTKLNAGGEVVPG